MTLPRKKGPQCSILLIDKDEKILLQLRDDKPTIHDPGKWGTFGGGIEEGETPLQGAIRETKEELDYDLVDPDYAGNYPYNGYDVHFYTKKDPTLKLENLTVHEGQRAGLFTIKEIKELDTAFNAKEVILAIFCGQTYSKHLKEQN